MKNDKYTIAKVRIKKAHSRFLKDLGLMLMILFCIAVGAFIFWLLDPNQVK